MEIAQFKKQLKTGTISDDLIIFECSDNYFVANQYIDKICELKQVTKKYINSIFTPKTSTDLLFEDSENPTILYVLEVETFDEYTEDYDIFKNTVVICKKAKESSKSNLSNYIVKIPKLTKENIISYMKVICKGFTLSNEEPLLEYFYNCACGDIYKICSELDKIKLFAEEEQINILKQLLFCDGSDLYNTDIFKITDAMLKLADDPQKNKPVLVEFLAKGRFVFSPKIKDDDSLRIDPIAVSNILLKNFRNLVLVSPNSGLNTDAEFEAVGISSKQKVMLKRYYPKYTSDFLRDKIKFLSNVDLDLKSSKLDLTKDRLFDYILCNVVC